MGLGILDTWFSLGFVNIEESLSVSDPSLPSPNSLMDSVPQSDDPLKKIPFQSFIGKSSIRLPISSHDKPLAPSSPTIPSKKSKVKNYKEFFLGGDENGFFSYLN